jgi:hypothetical protein
MNTWFLNKMISLNFFRWRDKRDSGHEKVCLAGLYFVLTIFDDFLQLGPVPFERSDKANFSRPGTNKLKI